MRCKGCQGKWGEVKVREDVKSARDMFYTFLLFWVFSMLFYVTAVLKCRTPIYLPPPILQGVTLLTQDGDYLAKGVHPSVSSWAGFHCQFLDFWVTNKKIVTL